MRVVVLTVLCAVCSAVILVMVKRQDTTAPTIEFEKTSIYYNGRDVLTLLEGVTAVDDRDGDVSETLMVTDIYPLSDGTGIVVYAAKDMSNNVVTAGRGFFYEGYDTSRLPGVAERQDGAGAESVTGVAPGAFGDAAGGETGADPDGAGMPGAEGEQDGADLPGGGQVVDGEAGTTDGGTDAGNARAGEGGADTAGNAGGGAMSGEEYDRLREQNLSQGIPFVRLVQYEAVLERGSAFNIYRYIDEAVDDTDSIRTMLRVEGSVDTNTPGEYEVRVFAKDSDGNESNVEILTVTVE